MLNGITLWKVKPISTFLNFSFLMYLCYFVSIVWNINLTDFHHLNKMASSKYRSLITTSSLFSRGT